MGDTTTQSADDPAGQPADHLDDQSADDPVDDPKGQLGDQANGHPGNLPAGHPSTPGYTDPAYPIEGRVARISANPPA